MLPTRQKSVNGLWEDPFRSLHRELDRVFGLGRAAEASEGLGNYPVDIHEDEGHVYVEAEMPGFKKDEVDVQLEDGMLSITAERKTEPKEGTSHLAERRYTKVSRRFTVPSSVDSSKVDAKLDHGVLHITLHKSEEVKPRRIEIQ